MNDEQQKITHAVSTSVLFDMSEADGIYKSKGPEAYIQHMIERQDEPLKPGPAFETFRGYLDNPEIFEVILASRNSPITARPAILSLRNEGLTLEKMFFTSGRSPVPYLPAYGLSADSGSFYHTANQQDSEDAARLGILSPYHWPNNTAPVVTKSPTDDNVVSLKKDKKSSVRPVFDGKRTHDVVFDLDCVVFDSLSDDFYRQHGLVAYRQMEHSQYGVPIGKGPAYNAFAKHIDINDRYSDQGAKPFDVHVVTVRGGPAGYRGLETLYQWRTGANISAHFLSGGDKEPVLRVIAQLAKEAKRQPPVMYDDQPKYVEQARNAGLTAGQILPVPDEGPLIA